MIRKENLTINDTKEIVQVLNDQCVYSWKILLVERTSIAEQSYLTDYNTINDQILKTQLLKKINNIFFPFISASIQHISCTY